MYILLKYIIHNLFEKKVRLVLLIICLSICTGLFLTNLGLTQIILQSSTDQAKEPYNNKEYLIYKKHNELFSKYSLNVKSLKDIEYIFSTRGTVNLKNKPTVNLLGVKNNSFNIKRNQIVISKNTAEHFNLHKGSSLKIICQNKKFFYKVSRIVPTKNRFINDTSDNFLIYVNSNYLTRRLGIKNSEKYNMVYANAKSSKYNNNCFTSSFSKLNPDFLIKTTYNIGVIKSEIQQIQNYMNILLVIVVLISLVIIINTFKLITLERIPTLGTFISLGATKKQIIKILISESVFYGLIGGVGGCICGMGVLSLAGRLVVTSKIILFSKTEYISLGFLLGILFSILLTIIASLLPIMHVSRIPVKQLVLQTDTSNNGENRLLQIISIFLLVFVCIFNSKISNHFSLILLTIFIIVLILGTPLLLEWFFQLLSKFFRYNSFLSYLSTNTLAQSKILRKSMLLIIMSLLLTLLVTSATSSFQNVVRQGYSNLNYDFQINLTTKPSYLNNNEIYQSVKKYNGVKQNSLQTLTMLIGKIGNQKNNSIVGINVPKYLHYDHYLNWQTKKNLVLYDHFKNGPENAAIASTRTMKDLKIKPGDLVKIKLRGKTNKLKVIGSIDGKLEYNSKFILVKDKWLTKHFNTNNPYLAYLLGDLNKEYSVSRFKSQVRHLGLNALTHSQSIKQNDKNNQTILSLLDIFSFTALIIAGFGVFSNVSISYLYRQKENAVLITLGLSFKQKVGKNFIESSLMAIISFIFAIIMSDSFFKIFTSVTDYLGLPLVIRLKVSILPWALFFALIIVWLSVLVASLTNKKADLLTDIKQE